MAKICIMLAAGLSRRMGKWKMMMPWGDGTILDSALDSALAFCDQVILVTGHRGDELAACYEEHPAIRVVYNPDYQSGMFSSVQCGVSHLDEQHFFLALGDMPEVSSGIYRRLWAAADRDACFIPCYQQGKGHPVLLPPQAVGLISAAAPDSTLREVIRQLNTCIVPVEEQGIHWDVDTPQQYRQIAGLSRKGKPV